MLTGDAYELARADRTDSDPLALRLHENFAVPTPKECGGIAAHAAMHGDAVGTLCGTWLNSNMTIETVVGRYSSFAGITAKDTGA